MIDWTRVADLRAEIGADGFDEVVALFLDEADEVAARLALGPATGAALRDDLHFLKGSALNLGFVELARLCQEGERRAAQGGPVEAGPVVACYLASRRGFEAGRGAEAA